MKSSDQCPDLEELAALADGQTDPGSREHLLEHLDSCEDCYEVFAETVRFSEEVDGVEQDSRNQGLWTSLSPVARAGLAAAAMLILLVASYAFLERSGLEAELEILRSEREEWLEEQDQMQHQIAMSFSQPEASGALPQQHLFEQTLSPSPGLRDASGCDPVFWIGKDQLWVHLNLLFAPRIPFESYGVALRAVGSEESLLDIGGLREWPSAKSELDQSADSSTESDPTQTVVLRFSSSLLSEGTYRLTLEGVRQDGGSDTRVADYYFRVDLQQPE